jgi:flagellar hook-length control protein FliK
VSRPAAQSDATVATDVTLAATGAATKPATPKSALFKAPAAAKAGAAPSTDSAAAPGTADASATAISTGTAHADVAPQPASAGKEKAENAIVDTAKTDAAAGSSSTPATAVAPHQPSATPETGQALTGSSDAGVQATGTIQPQLPAAAAAAAPAGPFSVTAATNVAVPLSGLALEIAASARSGKSRFEIRLDPADLGRIDVRIDVDRSGQVTSHVTVEKPETLSMLRQDAPQLQRQLDDAGFKTGSGGLQFSLRDQSSSNQNNGDETGRNAQRLVVSSEDPTPAAVVGRTYGRMLGSSSGVDIKV